MFVALRRLLSARPAAHVVRGGCQRHGGGASGPTLQNVKGDWREELVVITTDSRFEIFQNVDANPNPERQRLWSDPPYRRLKMTFDYYSN